MTKGTILSVSLIAAAMLATLVAARERHGSARIYAVESDVTTAPGQVYLGAQSCNPGRASAPLHPHRGTTCPRAIPAMAAMPPIRPIRCGDTDRYTPASLLEQGSQSSVRRPRRGGRLVMSPKASDIGAGLIAAFG